MSWSCFQQWLEQLPADVVDSRPRLCLACAQLLWHGCPTFHAGSLARYSRSNADRFADTQTAQEVSSLNAYFAQRRQDQENLLGEVIAWRALLQCYQQEWTEQHSRSVSKPSLCSLQTITMFVHMIE